MLNSVQHLTKSRPYEILKQVQDDKSGLFTKPLKSNQKERRVLDVIFNIIQKEGGCCAIDDPVV